MAWETRRNGRRYFYSAKRVKGKVVRTYHGRGEQALMVELTIREIARKRKADKDAWDHYLAELWTLESISKLAKTASRSAIHAAYLIAGYKQTQCHHWIKTKDSKMVIPTFADLPQKLPPPEEAAVCASDEAKSSEAHQSPPYWPQSIDETIKLVTSGRKDLLGLLRAQLADVPKLWEEVSDLTRVAIQGWARKLAQGNENVAFRESIVLAATSERHEMLAKCSSNMERAIVDRWIINKLQLAYFDIVMSCQADSSTFSKASSGIEQRYRSAEHQFREATRQLSKVRILETEIAPETPTANSSFALKLHNPDSMQTRKSA